jgi:ESCRT-I complex subunit VPS37
VRRSSPSSSLPHRQNVRPGGGGAAHPGTSTIARTLSIPKEFPGLLELTSSELGTLLTDPTAFARFLHGTEGARESRAFTRDLRLEIEGMCRANIEMAEEAVDLRSQMQVIRSCDMQPVKEGYDAVKARADALLSRYNLREVLRGLKDRAAAADAASEALSEEMVAGKVSVDDFVERYRNMREAYHLDAVKVDIVEPALPQPQRVTPRYPQQPRQQARYPPG